MLETAIALFAAHVLADYVFQTKRMAEEKSNPLMLAYHGVVVLLTAVLLTGHVTWPVMLLVGLHIATDVIKALFWNDKFASHISDQAIHLIKIAAVSALAPHLWATGFWQNAPIWVPHVLLLSAGILYATRAGGFAVAKLMAPYVDAFTTDSLPGGGKAIGLLERGLIYILMIAGQPIGIGFLIAAKSVLRFETAKDGAEAENRRRSEYIIIGTLASFGWAILVSLAALGLLSGLPPLEITRLLP